MGSAPLRRPNDAGFLLVEAVIATALIAICAGAALAAAAAVTHASARALAAPALTLSAQNVLADLRAATVYDPAELAALENRTAALDADEPAPDGSVRRIHLTVQIARSAGSALIATVTAQSAAGATISVAATLDGEAPAPGSVVSAAPNVPAGSAFPSPEPSASGGIAL